MADQPRSRDDVARRLAAYLRTEVGPELLEVVPPIGWDEIATRTELRDELGRHQDHLDRRVQAIRDALAVIYQDEVRRLVRWNVALAVAVLALAVLADRVA